ncbi:MAG: hypothetical protein QXH96_01360 [Candidatus Geothermarchaeota archaeon]
MEELVELGKDTLLKLFEKLLRGKSLPKALYECFIEGDFRVADKLIAYIKRGYEKIDLPYVMEAKILSEHGRKKERLSNYLRRIIEIEHIKDEINELILNYRRKATILLIVLYISVPLISAFSLILAYLPFFVDVELFNMATVKVEMTLEELLLNPSLMYSFVSVSISTIYFYRYTRINILKLLTLQIALFVILYFSASTILLTLFKF